MQTKFIETKGNFGKEQGNNEPSTIVLIHKKDFPGQYKSYFSNESGSTEKILANQAINHAWSFTSFRKRIQIFRGKPLMEKRNNTLVVRKSERIASDKWEGDEIRSPVKLIIRGLINKFIIHTDEMPGFFLLLKNHIFTARSEDTIFIFLV